MQRFVLALLVGGVLAAAVYGSTATLGGIGNPDLGADDALVVSCDSDGIQVDYSIAYNGGVRVTDVHVTKLADACLGLALDVFLTHGGAQIAHGAATVVAGTPNDNKADVALGATGPLAEDVDDIHVAIR